MWRRTQERVHPLPERRPGRPRHREHVSAERERVVGGDQRAQAPRLASITIVTLASAAIGSGPGKRHGAGSTPRPRSRRSRRPRDPSGKRAVLAGMRGCRSMPQPSTATVRPPAARAPACAARVDAEREPRDDSDTRAGEAARACERDSSPGPAPRTPASSSAGSAHSSAVLRHRARVQGQRCRHAQLIEHGRPLGVAPRRPRGSSDNAVEVMSASARSSCAICSRAPRSRWVRTTQRPHLRPPR